MKKKSDNNKLDTGIDLKGIEGLEDDLDFGELENIEDNRNPSKAEVSKELVKEAGKGFLDSVIKKSAAKALPEEYANNYYSALEYADFAKETFETNKSKINKSFYKLGKEVKKILPFQSKLLNKFLEKYETDFEQFKSQTEEQIRESGIQSSISSIFDKQLEIQKAFEAKRSAEAEVDKKERISLNKINLDVLTNIDSNTSNLTAFTLQINKEYYRKSLELQYKSYFIQADMLKTMRDYYKGFSLQFDNIVKNTGLPDFVKLKSNERLQEIVRTQFIENSYKQLFSNSEYIKNVKQKISNLVNEKVTGLTDSIDNVTDMVSGINQAGEFGGGGGRVLGGVLANMGGSVLGEKLANKISPKIKDKIKDNKYINAGGNYLSMLANSPSTLFGSLKNKTSKKMDEYGDESTPLRFLASKLFSGANELLGATDPGMKEYSVNKQSILSHGQPAIFDNKVHRSISEVIPMYLAKILNENMNLRYMYKSVHADKLKDYKDQGEKVYDYENRKLVSSEDFKMSIQKSIFKDNDKQSKKLNEISGNISSLAINNLQKDPKNKSDIKTLNNKKLQNLFNNYLSKASGKISDENFTYDNLVTNYESNKDLEALVNSNPKLKEYLEILKKSDISKTNSTINEKMLDTKRVYPILPIKELFKNTSKIINSKTLNNIKDNVANIISKAFTIFITNTNTDLNIDDIANGKCFSFIEEKDIKSIKPFISLFITEVKKIKMSDDIVKESSLELLLGIVNRSLKDNFEIDPSVFQTLYEYSPLLQDKGKLTTENLVEGKLGKFEDNDFIDSSEIKNLAKSKIKDINKIRTDGTKLNLVSTIQNTGFGKEISNYANIFSTFKQDIDNASGYKEISTSVSKMFNSIVSKSKESGSKLYSSAIKKIDEINKFIVTATSENIPKVKQSLVNGLNKYITDIDTLIETIKVDKKNELINFSEMKKSITDNINDSKVLSEIDKNISKLVKIKDLEIKTLEKFKVNIINRRREILNMDVKSINLNEFLENTKNIFDLLRKEAKETLAEIEAESEENASVI